MLMQTMEERTGHERIDDLKEQMDRRFDVVDTRFDLVDKRFDDASAEFRRISASRMSKQRSAESAAT